MGALNEFGYTGKPQHTLQDLAGIRRLRVESPRFRHDGAKVPRLHQGDEALGPQDRDGVG